jgi:hypothetical protein
LIFCDIIAAHSPFFLAMTSTLSVQVRGGDADEAEDVTIPGDAKVTGLKKAIASEGYVGIQKAGQITKVSVAGVDYKSQALIADFPPNEVVWLDIETKSVPGPLHSLKSLRDPPDISLATLLDTPPAIQEIVSLESLTHQSLRLFCPLALSVPA